ALALAASPAEPIVLNAWIHVGADDFVTVLIDKSEMGQSILTGLAMIAADELDCDWTKVRTEFAPADKVYINPRFGVQGTGGSSGTPTSWNPLRKASATARAMLLEAAAQKWGVNVSECRAENSTVIHTPTKRSATYGSLAEAAAKLSVPENVPLKEPAEYRLIGKPTKRLDTPLKVNGSAQYGIDVRQPGMLYAVVTRCPVFGGKVASFDATKARAVSGVKDVIQISSGVAIVADNTWSAMEGRRALAVKWDEGPNANLTTAEISRQLAEAAAKPGAVARKEGDVEAGLAGAATKFEVDYEVPFLAHATMEPMNCTAHVRGDRCDVWAPTQAQTGSQVAAAKITGLDTGAVFVHTTFLGGGFGRRFESDFIGEAVEISKAMSAPVKVTWSREDDVQHDYYRMVSHARGVAGLDAEGWPVAWSTRVSSPSLLARFAPLKDNFDHRSVESLDNVPYAIPNILVDFQLVNTGIPIGFWRSVGASQNGFFLESFVDEMATAGKKDPYEFRRHLLAKSPRHLKVLETAAENAGWGKPLPAGRFRGIAVVTSYEGFVAQVIEISVNRADRKLRVHRVVCALDCGRIVNPSSIDAQARSSIVYGLTAAMYSAITIDQGRVQQHNFNDYKMLRFDEMPDIEVHIVPTDGPPTGAGEFALPPVAPALCNAIFTATGRRIRRLPIRPEDLA
ncbi:MAG TPA: xanthine dehydrogenase family protein molybdopterin-binding subunit, partial [Candidatus Acidoferrales bacterium]|nr:xanthine dehydrogenase family protein molybdopterin-binding subunit [Candidatus Acidoferrales bacterium]